MSGTELAARLDDVERMVIHTVMDDISKMQTRLQYVEATLGSLSDDIAPLLRAPDGQSHADSPEVPSEQASAQPVPGLGPIENPFSMPAAPAPQPGAPATTTTPQRPSYSPVSPGDETTSLRHLDDLIHDMQQVMIKDSDAINANTNAFETQMVLLREQAQRADVP